MIYLCVYTRIFKYISTWLSGLLSVIKCVYIKKDIYVCIYVHIYIVYKQAEHVDIDAHARVCVCTYVVYM